MYQKKLIEYTINLYFENVRKKNIFVNLCQLQNINQKKRYRNTCSYCYFINPVDVHFVGCQFFVYLSQVN